MSTISTSGTEDIFDIPTIRRVTGATFDDPPRAVQINSTPLDTPYRVARFLDYAKDYKWFDNVYSTEAPRNNFLARLRVAAAKTYRTLLHYVDLWEKEQKQNQELSKEVDQLKEENKKLQDALDSAEESTRLVAAKAIEREGLLKDDHRDAILDLNERNDAVQESKNQLKDRLRILEDQLGQYTDQTERIKQLEFEVGAEKGQRCVEPQVHTDIIPLRASITAWKEDFRALNKVLQDTSNYHQKQIDELTREGRRLVAENQRLAQETREAQEAQTYIP